MGKLKPRASRAKIEITDAAWRWLCDEPPEVGGEDELFSIRWEMTDLELGALWRRACRELLEGWVEKAPGTRPSHWWQYDSPEPSRRFISGAGVGADFVLAYAPQYHLGVPVNWVGLDASSLPVYESQAAFLKRHELLSPAEAAKLTPQDFEPEICRPVEVWFVSDSPPTDPWLREKNERIREKILVARREHGMVRK